MKRLAQSLVLLAFAALALLSCRSLVAGPSAERDALPALPMRAAISASCAAVPEQDVAEQSLPDTASRRLLPDVTTASPLPAAAPVRDGNGTPLRGRPYVRTVYTACRLEETSG